MRADHSSQSCWQCLIMLCLSLSFSMSGCLLQSIAPGFLAPPFMNTASCVYVFTTDTNWAYCGQTDHLPGRTSQ